MNLGQLKIAVDRRTGIAYDPAAATEALNEALQQISTEERWPWLQDVWLPAIVAGTKTYSPPAGTTSVRSVTVNGQEIWRAHISVLDGDVGYWGWAFEKEQLVLSPVPGGGEVVQVRISKAEPALVADGDTPLLPAEWHPALVNLASSIVLERLDELQRADRRQKAYDTALRRMRHTARRNRGVVAAKVRPGGGI